MRVIGLMSGTSLDGIDAALIDIDGDAAAATWRLVAFREQPYSATRRAAIHERRAGELHESADAQADKQVLPKRRRAITGSVAEVSIPPASQMSATEQRDFALPHPAAPRPRVCCL